MTQPEPTESTNGEHLVSGREQRFVMLRDASYWSKPGFASKYHCVAVGKVGPLGHSVALCSKRIQLNEASAINKSRIDETLICKRCATMNSSAT